MTNHRTLLRKRIRETIKGAEQFWQFCDYRDYSRDVTEKDFPFFVVRTPLEKPTIDESGLLVRPVSVHINVRRMWAIDVEDKLDSDSDVIEALVLPILSEVGFDHTIDSIQTDVMSDGGPRVGTLDMVFRVTRYTGNC